MRVDGPNAKDGSMSTKSCLLRSTPGDHFLSHVVALSAPAMLQRNNIMRFPELTASTTLRWTVLVAGFFAAFTVALLGFVYLKTMRDLTSRSDHVIALQMGVLAALPPGQRLDLINEGLKQDLSRIRLVGLFGLHGDRIAGNVERLPHGLRTDGTPQSAVLERIDGPGRERQAVRLLVRALPDENVLLVGRNADEVEEIGS